MTTWLLPKKGNGNYWAIMRLVLRADNPVLDGVDLPGMYHFMRLRYTGLGVGQDLVLSFVTPKTTINDGQFVWLLCAQEQPWLGIDPNDPDDIDDAEKALRTFQNVLLMEWKSYPSDGINNTGLGREIGGRTTNWAVVSQDAETTADVPFTLLPAQTQITRRMGA